MYTHTLSAVPQDASQDEKTARRIARFDRCYSFCWSWARKERRWWSRSEKLWKFVYVSGETACYSFSPWSDLILILAYSIYFYILNAMGKRVIIPKNFAPPKWLIHRVEIRLVDVTTRSSAASYAKANVIMDDLTRLTTLRCKVHVVTAISDRDKWSRDEKI